MAHNETCRDLVSPIETGKEGSAKQDCSLRFLDELQPNPQPVSRERSEPVAVRTAVEETDKPTKVVDDAVKLLRDRPANKPLSRDELTELSKAVTSMTAEQRNQFTDSLPAGYSVSRILLPSDPPEAHWTFSYDRKRIGLIVSRDNGPFEPGK